MAIRVKRIRFLVSYNDMRAGNLELILEDQIKHFETVIGPMISMTLLEKAELDDGIAGFFIATFRSKYR